jgi:hypothetical protein
MASGNEPNIVDDIYIQLKANNGNAKPITMTQASLTSLMDVAGVGQARRSLSKEDCQAIGDYLRENPILFETRTPFIIDFFESSGGVTVIGLQ